jgi:hypothetical protein
MEIFFHIWAKRKMIFILSLWHRAMVVNTQRTRINQQVVAKLCWKLNSIAFGSAIKHKKSLLKFLFFQTNQVD